MSSRDFGFLTLRNIQAYQSNGNPVPPNQVLVTSGAGSGGFTNSLIISTICVSTVEVSTIFIDREIASSINTNTINTNFLTVNSTTNLSTTIINNTLSLVGNTPADSEIWLHNYKSRLGTSDPYGGLYLEASTTTSIWFSNLDATAGPYAQIGKNFSAFYGSVNVASTLVASTLDARYISSYTIDVQSTLRFFDGPSTVILDAQGSTLYVNGFPILSGGSISSVSSLFWLPRNPTDGSIYNENIGTAPNYYQIGLGTNGNQLNALVDIANNTYTGTKNVFNISSFNNRFVIDNINSSIQNYMTARFIDNQNNPFATALKFEKTINFQSTTSNCELGYIDFYGTNPSQSTVRGAYILARQQNLASTFAPTDLQFLTCTSSTETINMVITSQGNVGIGTTTPESTLTVFGSCYISSGLTIDGGGAGGGGTTYGSLKIQGGIDENSILIQDGTSVTPNTGIYNGYFIGNSINFGGASTFQIGRIDSVAEPNKAIYMTQAGNVGINTFTPQFTFDVLGSMKASSYVSTNNIRMNTGNIYSNQGIIYDLGVINNATTGIPLSLNDTNVNINNGNLIITATNSYLSTNNINMGGTNSNLQFSSILNIDSSANAVNNGIINIGTAQNSVIYMGSAGSTRTHIINGNLSTSQNVGIGITPSYKLDVNGTSRFVSTYQNSSFGLVLQNLGATSTSTEIYMANGNGAYGIYATQSGSSPTGTGLIPSTFQIYSYYSNPLNILTLYPNGNLNVNGFITPTGTNGNRLVNALYDATGNITLSALMPGGYTISNNTYVRLVILAIGGGGGGGGAFTDGQDYGGAGGGSGQEVTTTYYVLPTTQLAITIGNGGGGGTGISGSPDNTTRGTNGGTTIITSSNNATILVSAAGGNGADNNGLTAVNPDFGGNGYYGGGGGGGNDTNFINTGGASCVLYSVRTGNNRYIPATYTVAAAGGTGDGPAGPGTGGIGGTPNANIGYSGGGGASSALGTGGNGGNGSSNSNINGTNGNRGAGGGGGGQANSSYGNGGTGGNGCVYIQVFAL